MDFSSEKALSSVSCASSLVMMTPRGRPPTTADVITRKIRACERSQFPPPPRVDKHRLAGLPQLVNARHQPRDDGHGAAAVRYVHPCVGAALSQLQEAVGQRRLLLVPVLLAVDLVVQAEIKSNNAAPFNDLETRRPCSGR